MITAIAPLLGEGHPDRSFRNPESSLKTSVDSVERLVQQAREAGINAEFPANALPFFAKAVEAGYGNEEVSAIFEVLRISSASKQSLA
ncbi:imine reductase family protein [Paenibacillus elgii]|uniref:imine reductase family protein n=1 Tax=Paenibacillus elgii TaxID=189691 RepID=UPI001F3BC7AE|nr:hypothetical protein [Paenibacillus elgii]